MNQSEKLQIDKDQSVRIKAKVRPLSVLPQVEVIMNRGGYTYIITWFTGLTLIFLLVCKWTPWLAILLSATISILASLSSYRILRYLVRRFLRKQIPFCRQLEKDLLERLPDDKEEIIKFMSILKKEDNPTSYIQYIYAGEIQNLATALIEGKQLEGGGWFRPLNINYIYFCVRNLDLAKFIVCNKQLPIEVLAKAVSNIVTAQSKGANVKHVSVRNVFGGVTDKYVQSSVNSIVLYFKRLDEDGRVNLMRHLRKSDLEQWKIFIEGKKKEVFTFDDKVMESFSAHDINNVIKIMESMRSCCRTVASNIVTSETHIVLSSLFKTENGNEFMIISATNTDKNSLVFFAHTPLVWPVDKQWNFFGDEDFFPSSETRSHWRLHHDLLDKLDNDLNYIVHCHSVDVLDYVKPQEDSLRDIDFSKGRIKTLGWAPHGNADFGGILAHGMLQSSIPAVVIEDHGLWVAGRTFDEASDLMRNIVSFAIKQLLPRK